MARLNAMRVAVVGAGAAGLTAAYRLRRQGHEVVVFEAADGIGGRIRTTHPAPGLRLDEGARRVGSFYASTLALFDELGERHLLRAEPGPAAVELALDGTLHPLPDSIVRLGRTDLLTATDKARLLAWIAALAVGQPDGLRIDIRDDGEPALAALQPIGERTRERLMRPLLERTLLFRLESMSGALVRAWLRALSSGTFVEMDGGMDGPWRRLADGLDVHLATPVVRIVRRDAAAVLTVAGEDVRFDAAVVAVPAPVAGLIVDEPAAPAQLRAIEYAPHVGLFAARRGGGTAHRRILVAPGNLVASVERRSVPSGVSGGASEGWESGLVATPAVVGRTLLDLPDEIVVDRLWREARSLDPDLFALRDAEIVRLFRWRHAVPVVGPGYYRRLAALRQTPPIVFAGDWLVQPCIEGAVRSGNAAAAILTGTRS